MLIGLGLVSIRPCGKEDGADRDSEACASSQCRTAWLAFVALLADRALAPLADPLGLGLRRLHEDL